MEDDMGHIYKRGDVYWIKYYRNGKPYRESTKSVKEADAKRLLKKREGEISEGKLPGIYFERVLFDDLATDFISDYRINNKRSLDQAELSVEHLSKFFEGFKVVAITTSRIRQYIEARQKEGAANATINRELAALKRMLNLGLKQTPPRVERLPFIPMLQENNVRKGFLEAADFFALRDALPGYLKGFVNLAYRRGLRLSEIAGLTWPQVDLDNRIVRLEVGSTKNKEGRTIIFDDELLEVFQAQWNERKRAKKLTPYVFPNRSGDSKITDIRKAWNEACRKVGIGYGYEISKAYVKKWREKLPPGPIFHDFRRTAVRNMVRAGVSERVAMMVSGHKTRSVFDRYDIVNEADLKVAAEKMQLYLEAQKMVTVSGTVQKKRVTQFNVTP
jgi:integrase